LTPFDERIAPLSQRRNVHVDPVVPPIDRARVVAEIGAFFRWQGSAQLLDVRCFKHVIVQQDERFEQRDELDHLFEFTLAARQRRPV
jgi:hypothetical protein